MKKQTRGYVILGILALLVSVTAFAVPAEKTGAFWIAYAFTLAAIAAQIVVWKVAFGREDSLKSRFLGLPVIHIGVVYLVLQLIVFAVFLFTPAAPAWSAVIACALIAGISAVCMISADTGRGEIERVEAKIQEKVFYLKSLQVDAELLARQEADPETRAQLEKLAEKLRFSDPMSHPQLSGLESALSAKIAELKTAPEKQPLIQEANALLEERNAKCKILK